MVGPLFGVAIALAAAIAIIRKFQPNMVLLLAGLALNLLALPFGDGVPSSQNVFVWLDFFGLTKAFISPQVGGICFITLVAGGFARYMEAIGASDRFIHLFLEPLRRLSNPYLILAIAFILGNALGFVIPSASGLAMLAFVTAYPLLIRLGCSPLSVVAIIASCQMIAYAPMSGGACLAADTVGLTPMQYLVTQQLPLAIPVVLIMAMAHGFIQHYYDEHAKWRPHAPEAETPVQHMPLVYAFLPLTPLILMLAFNSMIIGSRGLKVASAMLLSWLLSFFIDLLCRGHARKSFKLSFAFFEGMGTILTSTVGLIFVALYFAQGLRNIGLVEFLLHEDALATFNAHGSSLILCIIVGLITIITGSGTAAFTSMAHMVPELGRNLGIDPVSTMLMINTTSEMLRAMSPVAGVVIIVSGYAHISPFAVVRRTWAPCLIGFLAMLTTVALEL